MVYANTYAGLALIADPIYRYASFTVPRGAGGSEATEKDLLDSVWVQKLRRIYQLQSARWVYPAAEHSRFQHSLGTMHMAGKFARHLYPSLQEVCRDLPSPCYLEELLRIAGLLHDVGHGPYGHFFDDNYLDHHGITHEDIGRAIITSRLGDIIRAIRRSPSGGLAAGETIDPSYVSFLIKKPAATDKRQPKWLKLLRQLFSGIYTVDNLDYVQRDAFMTGFSLDIVDMERLLFYSFFTREGLTLHQTGISALGRFLNARINLYTNVYFHRTTRALDMHLQEIFRRTLDFILPESPLKNLDLYLDMDEWFLYHKVQQWLREADPVKRELGQEWRKLHQREVKWKMSFSTEISIDQINRGAKFLQASDYEAQIRANLPARLRTLEFVVDIATQDPRPLNPMREVDKQVSIYDPVTRAVSLEPLMEIYRFIPARVVHFRIFSKNHDQDEALSQAAGRALDSWDRRDRTNL